MCRSSSLATSGALPGPLRAWLLLASSAELLTRRAPTSRSPTSISNNECAKRSSVCIALLLLIRDVCFKRGGVVLTGDFNKGAKRELPLVAPTVSVEFLHSRQPSGRRAFPGPLWWVTPLWGPRAEPHGDKWPESFGFVILPGSQSKWLIMKHGSFCVKPAELGLKPNDQTWHYEQWLYSKFASRKRRWDASPADSNSRRRNWFV